LSKALKILRISPVIAFKKAIRKFYEKFLSFIFYKKDIIKITYKSKPEWLTNINYHTLPLPEIEHLEHFTEQIKTIAALVANNEFDMLGSGIKKITISSKNEEFSSTNSSFLEKNIEIYDYINSYPNKKNKDFAFELLKHISQNHEFIDWQVDFKSGYRWRQFEWSKKIKYGNVKGADIKVPWELGRLQFLIPLSYAFFIFKQNKQNSRAEHYAEVFQDILLDFRVCNPPRFGVQWMSPMDAAIRATNVVLAYSFFKQAGCIFDKFFEKFILEFICEHINFVNSDPEWNDGLRGNHYLACISSLVFISTYLPPSEYTKKLFAKSLKKLIKEIFYQFYDDGGNFEGSLPYHRFASEMVLFALFSALSLPKSRFELFEYFKDVNIQIIDNQIILSNKLIQRLFNIFEFTLFNSTKSHYFPQFGDNDGGYFIHLTPFYIKYLAKKTDDISYLFHSANNPWNLLSLFAGYFYDLIGNQLFDRYFESNAGKILRNKSNIVFNANVLKDKISVINKYLQNKNQEDIYKGKLFPNSGICSIWQNKYHLVFSIGKIGQRGKGGHNHSDGLSFELFIENVPIIVNAGTFCYTPYPKLRNHYRSIKSHNTIVYEGYEQNIYSERSRDDLFWVEKHLAKGKILYFADNSIIAEHYAFGKPCKRIINFDYDTIEFVDLCKQKGEKEIYLHFFPGVQIVNMEEYVICDYRHIRLKILGDDVKYKILQYRYSLNYGLTQNAECLIILSDKENVNWKIKVY